MAAGKLCSIENCDKTVLARGWCRGHYLRWWNYGDPTGGGASRPPRRTLQKWLIAHRNYDGEGCLIWPFGRIPFGYGTVRFNGTGEHMSAHRYMCILAHGDPPAEGLHAAHDCGNGHLGCVHPKHISWKTVQENIDDRVRHRKLRMGRFR